MKSAVQGRTYAYLLAAVAIGSAGIALLLYATGLFHNTELSSVDARFSIRGDEKPRSDIALVLIDDVTSHELPVRFPFPRSLHARVVDALNRDGAKTIAYDVEFLQPTKLKEDNALVNSVARARGKVVLADSQPDPQGRSGVFGGQQFLNQIGARAGNDQVGEDPDAVRRRIPYSVGNMVTFPLVAAEVASGKTITPSQMGGDRAWIDYAGPPGTYPSASFSRVLNGQVPPSFFKNKVVVVGASDPTLKDVVDTPVSGSDNLMSGSEVNANAIATALDDFPLKSTPLGLDLFLIALMGIIAPLASYRLSPIRALACGLLAGALYLVAAQLAFNSGRIVPVPYPMVGLGLSPLGAPVLSHLLQAF